MRGSRGSGGFCAAPRWMSCAAHQRDRRRDVAGRAAHAARKPPWRGGGLRMRRGSRPAPPPGEAGHDRLARSLRPARRHAARDDALEQCLRLTLTYRFLGALAGRDGPNPHHPAIFRRTMPGEAPRLILGREPGPGPYDADITILCLERPAETCAAIRSALGQRGRVFHVSGWTRVPARRHFRP